MKKKRFMNCGNLRVCLFRCEIRWMKNFGKKMKRENFLKSVWLGGGEKKNVMESKYFLSKPSKMWRKLGKKVCVICFMNKNAPVAFLGNNGSLFFSFFNFFIFCFLGTLRPFFWGAMLALAFLFSFLGKR